MAEFDVLYAEDEFTNRKLVEIHLNKSGITCDLANDGLQAFEKFKNNRYKAIILDVYMPGINGDVLAKKIRELDASVPLIAITSDDTEIEYLMSMGFRDVFIKPLRNKDYIDFINKYVRKVPQ